MHIIITLPTCENDIKNMQNVYHKTWLDTYPNQKLGISIDDINDKFIFALSDDGIKYKLKEALNLPKNQKILLANFNNIVVGVCRIISNEYQHQLQTLYILPQYQKQGIAYLLWKEAIRSLNNNLAIVVHLACYNIKAIEFYTRLGFVDTNRRWKDKNFIMKSGNQIPEMEMILNKLLY